MPLRMLMIAAVLVAETVLTATVHASQQADHSLVGRFEHAEIIEYVRMPFDEYILLTRKYAGKADWGEPGREEFGERLEGKITRITYEADAEWSTLAVMRAYREAIEANGFDILFECNDSGCGGRDFNHAVVPYSLNFRENNEDQRYLAARKTGPDVGDVHVAIYTVKAHSIGGERKNRVYTQVDVIEEQARQSKVVVVEADEMAQRIDRAGKVALYGIHFDTDSARIRPQSRPTLDEIATLLDDQRELRLLVVGHTDDQGAFDYNIDLSQRRAQAVSDSLATDYDIDPGRLKPWGIGFTAPVAPNDSDENRARNRRVELVEW